jgi:hypothetical protein
MPTGPQLFPSMTAQGENTYLNLLGLLSEGQSRPCLADEVG